MCHDLILYDTKAASTSCGRRPPAPSRPARICRCSPPRSPRWSRRRAGAVHICMCVCVDLSIYLSISLSLYIYIYTYIERELLLLLLLCILGVDLVYDMLSVSIHDNNLHPVSVRRFPSFRTQPLESLMPLPMNKWISGQLSPWRKSSKRKSCHGDRV